MFNIREDAQAKYEERVGEQTGRYQGELSKTSWHIFFEQTVHV